MGPSDTTELQRNYDELVEQFNLVANLLVQMQQLHSSLHLSDVIAAVHNTVRNQIGSDDFAIFARIGTGTFENVGHAGVAGGKLPSFVIGEGICGGALLKKSIAYDTSFAAIVPLIDGRDEARGAIVIVRLLEHKARLLDRDRELLDLLSRQAGLALEAALGAEANSRNERRRQLTQKDAKDSLVVRCHDRLFALRIPPVSQVMRMVAMKAYLPGTPPHCLGVIDWRGRIVPIIDLAACLGLRTSRMEHELVDGFIVLIYDDDGITGYAVDELCELSEVEAQPLSGEGAERLGEFVIGTVRLSNGPIVPLLETRALLGLTARLSVIEALRNVENATLSLTPK